MNFAQNNLNSKATITWNSKADIEQRIKFDHYRDQYNEEIEDIFEELILFSLINFEIDRDFCDL